MYERSSHEVVDELSKLTVEQQQQQQRDLDDDDDDVEHNDNDRHSSSSQQTNYNVAILTLQRSLFLENKETIRDIARECVKIYSRMDEGVDREFFKESTSKPYIAAYIEKLLNRKQPTKLFLGTQFRQVLRFIIGRNQDSFPDHINYLLSFINELRVAYSTLTHEDKKLIKSLSEDSMIPVHQVITKDASLYLYWACIEAARFCINASNMQRVIGANDLVNVLDNILNRVHKFSEKCSGRFFVIFIQSLEKALGLDLETSLRRSSFVSSANTKTHTSYNRILQDWIDRNREKLAELSLKVDDFANCWTILNDDLTLRNECFDAKSRTPFERTTKSSNAKTLSLMIEAATRLEDLDLLYGIRSLADDSHEFCNIPFLDTMISNLKGNFEETYTNLMNKCDGLDEVSLNEFLKACVESSLLRENSMNVDLLKSNWLTDSYKKLVESTAVTEESLETRLNEAKLWLGTWSDSRYPLDTDLVMSAYLRKVSKPSQELLPAPHDEAEWFLSRDFISQTLFSPTKIASHFKIYSILFEMLKLKDEDKHLPTELAKIHSKDLRWNNVLFRHLHDLNWLELLRQKDDKIINSVQFRAIKYNIHCKNTQTAMKISEDLLSKGTCDKAKIHCLLITMNNENQSNCERYKEILDRINLSTMGELDKNDLRLKVFRFLLRDSLVKKAADSFILEASYETGNLRLMTSDELSMSNWQDLFHSSRNLSKVRSLSLISKICHAKSESSLNKGRSVNSAFKLDLELLKQLNQQRSFKYQSLALECAVRILKSICDHHSKLDEEATKLFTCQTFVERTIKTWISIKSNLISLVSNKRGDALPELWRQAIIGLMKVMVSRRPNILLYNIIVSRLDSKIAIRPNSADRVDNSGSLKGEEIDLWHELYACINTGTDDRIDKWFEVIQETEEFVRELRRISYLCGENLHSLASDVNRKLTRFLNFMLKQQQQLTTPGDGQYHPVDASARRIELAARFRSICEFALKQIGVLLLFSKGPNLDTYGRWFKTNLVKNIQIIKNLIEDNLNHHLVKFDLSEEFLEDLQSFMRQVNNLFYECQTIISDYSNKLWMNLISPKLSRLNSTKIPMPGCPMSDSNKQPVTIHRISQTVELIASKTKPKRLILIGSDGIQHSYLLKAHEDLRQDQYMMDLFAVMNKLMSGRKEISNICRLRNYSVTPISSESGLIEWVNAPALADIYKSWLASPSGEKLTEDLFSSTCKVVCDTSQVGAHRSNHINCQTPLYPRATDIFFQLLWCEAKKLDKQSELIKQRPSRENVRKYRAEYDRGSFENVIDQLSKQVPNDLISKSLWRRSINSYAYWRKTKQFTHSCATISMVGYILGIGDRHLGNILLDYDTGEVVHIDFALFFELGQRISVPEEVPFRLTNTITRAFGFAGLEGGFTQTSRKVLNFLKENRSVLLHLFEPKNWSFMIVSPNVDVNENTDKLSENYLDPLKHSDDRYDDRIERWLQEQFNIPTHRNHTEQNELELESQLDDPVSVTDITTTPVAVTPQNFNNNTLSISSKLKVGSVDYDNNQKPYLNDLQVNIKPPYKIPEGIVSQLFERIREKLSGMDKQLSPIIAHEACHYSERPSNRCPPDDKIPVRSDPTITNDPQSTDDQVDALIFEATSLKNKAAMYEGWMSWV